MSSTNYPGINYALNTGANIDKDTGIRYGVISQNSVNPESVDDIYHGPHSKDMAFEGHRDEVFKAIRDAIEGSTKLDDSFRKEDLEFIITEAQEAADENIGNAYDGETDPFYEHGGYKIAKCLNNDLFVLKSPFYTYAQFCSPCVPGAGNLDSPYAGPTPSTEGETFREFAEKAGFPKVYCLGHDWFDDNLAPYPVFRVDNNEQVHHP